MKHTGIKSISNCWNLNSSSSSHSHAHNSLTVCMFVVSNCIFNLTVLGIFVSFYCCTVFKLFMCQSSLRVQELNKTYLLTYLILACDCRFRFSFFVLTIWFCVDMLPCIP